jgi:hypothetical protein
MPAGAVALSRRVHGGGFYLPIFGLLALLGLVLAACGGGAGAAAEPDGPKVTLNPGWTTDPEPASGPRGILREQEVDFGPVPLDTAIEYNYTLKNVGNAPLEIWGRVGAVVLDGC